MTIESQQRSLCQAMQEENLTRMINDGIFHTAEELVDAVKVICSKAAGCTDMKTELDFVKEALRKIDPFKRMDLSQNLGLDRNDSKDNQVEAIGNQVIEVIKKEEASTMKS